MTDKEKIESFGDMVDAVEKLTKPWKILAAWLLAALVATNLIWGIVHFCNLKWAYMTPEEFTQSQDFTQETQEQSYSQGATESN